LIKAIFFDWFNTLARYEPPREELHSQALKVFGIKVSPEEILPGLLEADSYFFEENAHSPIAKRESKEQAVVWARYQQMVVEGAGAKVDQELLPKIMKKVGELVKETRWTLFDDALPTLKELKQQNFIIGLLSNFDKDMNPIFHELSLEPYLDFAVTSKEVGADKPNPLIFQTALQRAGVDASEAVHVGDQYKIDVVGARGVGITPILIDRYNFRPEINDCPRIRSLFELSDYLKP